MFTEDKLILIPVEDEGERYKVSIFNSDIQSIKNDVLLQTKK